MQKTRDNSFFPLEFSSIVSLVCLFTVFIVAHLSSVFSIQIYGLTMQSWLLSLLAFLIPVWNIFADNMRQKISQE